MLIDAEVELIWSSAQSDNFVLKIQFDDVINFLKLIKNELIGN